jgi:hypothetical protein
MTCTRNWRFSHHQLPEDLTGIAGEWLHEGWKCKNEEVNQELVVDLSLILVGESRRRVERIEVKQMALWSQAQWKKLDSQNTIQFLNCASYCWCYTLQENGKKSE